MKYVVAVIAAAAIAPFAASANDAPDHCTAYAEAHHTDASHCACLEHAAETHHELSAKIEQIHSEADYQHAETAVKTTVAECFPPE